jgi:hypothetical protein
VRAAGVGSRGALWHRRWRKMPMLPQGTLDPGGLTGVVDGERGFVLARRISGERALPTLGRAVLLSPQRLCRHVLVCGATGSGKTETLLRLAWAVAKCTGAPVFYLDGKGDRDTARRFCALMSDAGRSTRVFPGDSFDGWRGEPHEIQGRLMQIVDYATVGGASWYRDIAKTTLGLVCGHPNGPPRSSGEALARMDLPALRGAHPGSSAAGALSEAQVNQVRLRFDLDTATTAIKNLQDQAPRGSAPNGEAPRRGRSRRRQQATIPLLPIHEPRTRGILARVTRTGRRR